MKPQLVTIIAAVLWVGCGESKQSSPSIETKQIKPVAEVSTQTLSPTAQVSVAEPVAEAAQPEQESKSASLESDRALHGAAREGDIQSVKQHLADGADVNAKADRGWTPLHNVAGSDHKEIVELLIKSGADVNATHNGGGTPLHRAAREGHKQIVELLIANGADVNARDEDDGTPLYYATNREVADLLRKHGGKTGEELKAEGK